MKTQRQKNGMAIGLIALVSLFIIVSLIGLFLLHPAPPILQGQVEATQIRISGKLPGRVAEFMVEEGQYVEAGDTLVHIYSPMAEAQLFSANALRAAASAENNKVDAGTRSEMIRMAHDMLLQSQAALEIAHKTYMRMQSLYDKGVVSEQKRDEAQAAYLMAQASESAARSQYEMAMKGAREEDRKAAAAMLEAADGSVAEVEALLEDSYLTAPSAGIVSEIFPCVGELVSIGAPVMNLTKIDDMWVSFNVREDLLQDFPVGAQLQASIPALGNKKVVLQVFHVKDMGSYAVWRATKVTGEYDAKTFNVKARPLSSIEGLYPGMSVLMEEKER